MDPMIEFLPTLNNGMRLKITTKTSLIFKDKDRKQISLYPTLCSMPGELLLKVAIDMGIGTPYTSE